MCIKAYDFWALGGVGPGFRIMGRVYVQEDEGMEWTMDCGLWTMDGRVKWGRNISYLAQGLKAYSRIARGVSDPSN